MVRGPKPISRTGYHHPPAKQGRQYHHHHHHVSVSWPLLLNIINITINITYLPVKEDEEDGKQTGKVVAE